MQYFGHMAIILSLEIGILQQKSVRLLIALYEMNGCRGSRSHLRRMSKAFLLWKVSGRRLTAPED